MVLESMIRTTVGVLALLASECAPDTHCDRGALQAALDAAGPSETVRIGGCAIAGPVVVPSGVTLAGEAGAVITGDGVDPAVTLRPGPTATVLEGVEVRVPSGIGVAASGAGAIVVRDLVVDADGGIAVGLREVDDVSIVGLSAAGPVDAANAASLPVPANPGDTATHGVAALDCGTLSASDLDLSGFATAALLVRGGTATIRDARIHDTRGVGARFVDSSASLTSSTLSGILTAPGLAGFAVAADGGGSLATASVVIRDGAGWGIFHDGSSGDHVDLSVARLEQAAVWSQNGGSLGLSGTGTRIEGNGVGGVIAVDVRSLTVTDAVFEGQRLAFVPSGGGGGEMMGDGVHVVRTPAGPPTDVTLRGVTMTDNARVGLLLDAASLELGALDVEATVEGSGTQLGALAQRVSALPVDWDAAIDRRGATAANDPIAEAGTPLDVTGIIMPPARPPADLLGP